MDVRLRNPDRSVTVAGPCTVAELLAELELNPTTVLVIVDGELAPAGHQLDQDARVEVRPVISGGAGHAPHCRVCGTPAIHEEPRHRAAWCAEHLVDHIRSQVRSAIDRWARDGERMVSYDDRILVGVSGGKDSLALWDLLLDLGYRADGLYLGLGIGGYSQRSHDAVARFHQQHAADRGGRLHVVDLADAQGFTTPQGAGAGNRGTCGICGLSKRYWSNRIAVERGYTVLATGHNLDDEAAVLFGNVLRWQDSFLARQHPILPATGDNQVRKVKPLYRLSEREMAAYCIVRGLDYIVEECPLVDGNTGAANKAVLDELERDSPGIKAQFLFGFLDREASRWDDPTDDDVELVACTSCGMPTPGPIHDDPADQGAASPPTCAFCRQQSRVLAVLGAS